MVISPFTYVLYQVQCNVFEGASGEVALTAAGGLRQIPGLIETYENAALVLLNGTPIHYIDMRE